MALQKMRWLMAALLCLVIWPGIAHGQSSELLEANSNYQSLYQQIRYSEAEAAPFGPVILVTHSQQRKSAPNGGRSSLPGWKQREKIGNSFRHVQGG